MLLAYLTNEPVFPIFILLAIALAVDWIISEAPGVMARIPHPVRIFGWIIRRLDLKLNREQRSERDRFRRGVVVAGLVTLTAVAIGVAVVAARTAVTVIWIIELAVVISLLAQRSLYDHVLAVADGLRRHGLSGGRQAVRKIVGRDPEHLDVHGVARAAIESCAENYSDGVVAPAFWYGLLGLPGIIAYKAINTMDSMIGYKNARYSSFGKAAARLDDAVNWLPARLSAVFIATASCFSRCHGPRAALATAIRDARNHRSPNAGWPEGAMAGALGVSLAGPRRYADHVADDAWIGTGRAQAMESDVRRALEVFTLACLVHGLVVATTASILLIIDFS